MHEVSFAVGFGGFGKNGKLGYEGKDGERRIIVGGLPAKKGLSMHGWAGHYAHAAYRLDGGYRNLVTSVAINDTVGKSKVPLTFSVMGDGKELWKSPPLQKSGKPRPCKVEVGSIKQLELRVFCTDQAWAHAVWIDPYLE